MIGNLMDASHNMDYATMAKLIGGVLLWWVFMGWLCVRMWRRMPKESD